MWTVIPSAPACSQTIAAATTLGSIVRRACRTVATWSMLTLSLAVISSINHLQSPKSKVRSRKSLFEWTLNFGHWTLDVGLKTHPPLRSGFCRCSRGFDPLVVITLRCGAPNPQYFINHSEAVANYRYLAGCVVIPTHRDLT